MLHGVYKSRPRAEGNRVKQLRDPPSRVHIFFPPAPVLVYLGDFLKVWVIHPHAVPGAAKGSAAMFIQSRGPALFPGSAPQLYFCPETFSGWTGAGHGATLLYYHTDKYILVYVVIYMDTFLICTIKQRLFVFAFIKCTTQWLQLPWDPGNLRLTGVSLFVFFTIASLHTNSRVNNKFACSAF